MFKKKELKTPSAIERIGVFSTDVILAPFNGGLVEITCKQLSYAEIRSCGEFSLIETFKDKMLKEMEEKDITFEKISEYSEFQYKVLKLALINPTYDEIIETVLKTRRINKKDIDEQFDELEEKLNFLELKNGNTKEIRALKNDMARNKLLYEFILPHDFVSFVFSFALKIEETDIKKVSDDMLYESALLALKGHDNPSDHLVGTFSDFNQADIDKRAWLELYDRQNAGE